MVFFDKVFSQSDSAVIHRAISFLTIQVHASQILIAALVPLQILDVQSFLTNFTPSYQNGTFLDLHWAFPNVVLQSEIEGWRAVD
jgi:hypothetical protein